MGKKIAFILIAVELLSVSGFGGGDQPCTVVTIPVNEKDAGQKFLTFDIEVNGKTVKALLDTGSVAPAMILKTSAPNAGVPPEGGKYDVKIGDIVLKDVAIRCTEKFNTSYPKDIIFGAGVAKRLYTIIDYPSNRALFYPCVEGTSYADADKRAKERFGELQSEAVLSLVCPEGHILTGVTIPGKEKLFFAVDTGWLGHNILTTEAVKRWGISGEKVNLDITIDGHEFKQILFKNTRVQGLEHEIPKYGQKGLIFGGILGVPRFMVTHRIGIDYRENKLHIGFSKKE